MPEDFPQKTKTIQKASKMESMEDSAKKSLELP